MYLGIEKTDLSGDNKVEINIKANKILQMMNKVLFLFLIRIKTTGIISDTRLKKIFKIAILSPLLRVCIKYWTIAVSQFKDMRIIAVIPIRSFLFVFTSLVMTAPPM